MSPRRRAGQRVGRGAILRGAAGAALVASLFLAAVDVALALAPQGPGPLAILGLVARASFLTALALAPPLALLALALAPHLAGLAAAPRRRRLLGLALGLAILLELAGRAPAGPFAAGVLVAVGAAAGALAAGFLAGALVGSLPPAAQGFLRFAALGACAAGALLLAGGEGAEDAESAAVDAVPGLAPSLLLVVVEGLRGDALAAAGPQGNAFGDAFPTLRRLAGEGVRLERCHVDAPTLEGTLAALLDLDGEAPLPARFEAAGAATALFLDRSRRHDAALAERFAVHADGTPGHALLARGRPWSRVRAALPALRLADAWARRRDPGGSLAEAVRWLERRGRGRFLAVVDLAPLAWLGGLPDADPARSGNAEGAEADLAAAPAGVERDGPGAEVAAAARRRYRRALARADGALDALLDGLARAGSEDRTLVVVTSAGGAALGEWYGPEGRQRRRFGAGVPLDACLRVPAVLRGPGRLPEGLSVPALASHRDLGASLVRLVGFGPPAEWDTGEGAAAAAAESSNISAPAQPFEQEGGGAAGAGGGARRAGAGGEPAGVRERAAREAGGLDLTALLEGRTLGEVRAAVTTVGPLFRAACDGRYHLVVPAEVPLAGPLAQVLAPERGARLFDLARDPREGVPLAAHEVPEAAALLEALRADLTRRAGGGAGRAEEGR